MPNTTSKVNDIKPIMLPVENIRPLNTVIDQFPLPKFHTITYQAGSPYGLLLALTYPVTVTAQKAY